MLSWSCPSSRGTRGSLNLSAVPTLVSWSLEWGLLRWERPGGTPEQLLPGKIVRHLRRDRRSKSPSKDLKVRAWHLPARPRLSLRHLSKKAAGAGRGGGSAGSCCP